jgi:hypothetical protein
MRILLKSFKVCNMHVERYLSRIRRSCSHMHTAPTVERVRAAGFVSEVLTQHRVNGGQDPRFTTSKQLLSKGVPLHRAKQRKTQKVRGSAGFFKFVKQEEDRRRERGETQQQLGGRKRRFQELATQWDASTQQQRRAFNALAIEDRRETLNDLHQVVQEEPPRTDPISVNGGFWGMSTLETPFTEQALVDTVRSDMGDLPAATEYLAHFRSELKTGTFVRDVGDITPGTQYIVPKPCWRMHHGLCVTRDAAIYEQVLDASHVAHRLAFTISLCPHCK